MYYPGSNDWWLDPSAGRFDIRANGGSSKATIDVFGNLGIGMTSPGAKIDIKQSANGPTGGLRLTAASSANTWNIYHNGANEDLGIARNNAASPSLSILATNGYVGVGTTNPQEVLQVNGKIMAADPGTNPNAVATKQYVDAAAAGGIKTWFRTPAYYQGNATGLAYPSTGVCGAGYHMCYINEWVGRKWDQSKETSPYNLYENAWVATYSYHMGSTNWHTLPPGASPDCANWSGLSDPGGAFSGTYVNMGAAPPTFGTAGCSNSYKVMCCQD